MNNLLTIENHGQELIVSVMDGVRNRYFETWLVNPLGKITFSNISLDSSDDTNQQTTT
jgi:hypothetical protein